MDSAYLNNSDNSSRIIYGADKMHIIIYYSTLNPFLYFKAEMLGLPFYETFSKLYLNIYILCEHAVNMLLNSFQSSCHLKSKHHW